MDRNNPPRVKAYLLLGSNLGDRQGYLNRAIETLKANPRIEVVHLSAVHETEPWPKRDLETRPAFLNQAAEIHTDLTPHELLATLKAAEVQLGRAPHARWDSREIDIDILWYGDLKLDSPELTLPHPRLQERAFMREPLLEIAPHLTQMLEARS